MIKIGDFIEDVPADTQLYIESQVDFSVVEVDKKDKPIQLIGNSKNRIFQAKTRKDCRLKFIVGDYMHTSIDARAIRPVAEQVSSIPVEVNVDQEPLSLQDSIKAFCAQMIQHEYGRDSDEVDAFEDMMDYDIPDDDDWQYEAKEVTPEVLEPQAEPEPETPQEDPPPAPEPTT